VTENKSSGYAHWSRQFLRARCRPTATSPPSQAFQSTDRRLDNADRFLRPTMAPGDHRIRPPGVAFDQPPAGTASGRRGSGTTAGSHCARYVTSSPNGLRDELSSKLALAWPFRRVVTLARCRAAARVRAPAGPTRGAGQTGNDSTVDRGCSAWTASENQCAQQHLRPLRQRVPAFDQSVVGLAQEARRRRPRRPPMMPGASTA